MAATETGTSAARALDDLYRAHAAEIYRYAYAVLGNHADAEDVTQTTFVNALRALERGECPRKARNWLIVIAHNIVRQRFRHEQSRPAEVALEYDVAGAPEDDDEPNLDELVRALQRIPPAQRDAIVMRELEGRSYKEIAEILAVSTSALETLLFRARRSLAEEIENLVTCEKAQLALSRRLDGRLGRKERRRLDDHLAECTSCARFAARQHKHRHAFKGLALLPLPLSLTLFKGTPSAAAATAVPTIGGAATVGGVLGGAGTGGTAAGGLLATAAAAKVAAVVAAVGVAGAVGAVGYQTVTHDQGKPDRAPLVARPTENHGRPPGTGARASSSDVPARRASKGPEASSQERRSSVGRGRARPTAQRGSAAPGRLKQPRGKSAPGTAPKHGKPAKRQHTVPDRSRPTSKPAARTAPAKPTPGQPPSTGRTGATNPAPAAQRPAAASKQKGSAAPESTTAEDVTATTETTGSPGRPLEPARGSAKK